MLRFPIFSHAVKDPTDAPEPLDLARDRIVVVEGLYTLLKIEPWSDATNALDFKVWVECPPAVARARLIERHLESGIEPDPESATRRGERGALFWALVG